jgi:hypothetical protein
MSLSTRLPPGAAARPSNRRYLAQATFAGAQSPIQFDAGGDTQRDSFLAVIRNGEFKSLH